MTDLTFGSLSVLPHPDFLTRVSSLVSVWHRRSRQRSELARLNDLELRDLALTPMQAAYEARKPFWRD
ncbi:MAG TPA: DUF1127 domain-containing protein [Candidatus Sulfotelmatobacter sp.]|nr:DUF1127 domain-containing protein [Candidatus Sulfotelmatobacter sp.]